MVETGPVNARSATDAQMVLSGFNEPVTHAPFREKQMRTIGVVSELGPQARHVFLEQVGVAGIFGTPNPLHQDAMPDGFA